MTADERGQIAQLTSFVRDWRKEDTAWKAGVDERLRAVEAYVTTDQAEAKVKSEAAQSNRLNRAQILTAAGIVGSFVLGVLNHFA